MKKIIGLVFLTIIVLAGCSDSGGGNNNAATKELASIAIEPANNRLAIGKTRQFTAKGTYSDGTTQDLTGLVTWSSSSPSVATITPNGMATAVAAGPTTITASFGTISGTTTLTIPPITLVTIAINPANPVIAVGLTQQFTATGAYSDNTTQDLTGLVTWSSSSPSVATIAPNGMATAVAAGPTTITASFGTISGTTTLSVTSAILQTIAVTPIDPSIAAGTTQQFTATGTFSNSTTQDLTASATWGSSDTAVATIDSTSGKATAVDAGSSTITATLGSVSGTTSLSVTAAVLQTIAVTPTDPSIAAGTTQQFTATGTFSNSTTQDLTASATWSSSDTAVATIDSTSGKATAVGAGSTAITATSGGKTGATTLTVTPLIVTGTWIGTYTIYDDPTDPSQIGTYSFQFVLNQNGTSVTGEATLRGNTPNQLSATAQLTGNVAGQQMNFSFTYYSPQVPENLLTDIGTAIIADNTMTGNVIENFQTRYNCSYIFTLTKTP